ncbi:cell division protein FtsB [Bizionia sp. APA-3]|nr:cell division protein FtsB [Bizionia sp. APA-3]
MGFAFLFLMAYQFPGLLPISIMLFGAFLVLILIDSILLFKQNGLEAKRLLPEKLSNGDDNPIEITLKNTYNYKVKLKLIDEMPFQYQKRDFEIDTQLDKLTDKKITYTLRPLERGEYHFGNLNVYVTSPVGLLTRRFQFGNNAMVPNYPSFLQLKKYMLLAFSNKIFEFGLKKIRRIGHTMEFEQIKEYVQGDDIRNINWKATAKRSQLMVNQFQDERSQPIYSVIDKGRAMKMPFNGLSLLDYAINATLVISNVALKKQDKAGMFAFSRKVDNKVVAERRPSQMNQIMETLYNLDTDFSESDFSRLYIDVKRSLNQRSLLLLYTNFETLDALHRQLPYLQAIAKHHVLVVIFFENTELDKLTQKESRNTFEIFEKTIAEKFVYEKKLIINELQKHGIQSILTAPEDLTLNTINKYLEIKARGLI